MTRRCSHCGRRFGRLRLRVSWWLCPLNFHPRYGMGRLRLVDPVDVPCCPVCFGEW